MLSQEHISAFLIFPLCQTADYRKKRSVLVEGLYHRKVGYTEHIHGRCHYCRHGDILQGIADNSKQVDKNGYFTGFKISCLLIALCRHAYPVQLVGIDVDVGVVSHKNTEV